MNTVKISMILGLGFLCNSPLAAMQDNNDMDILRDNIEEIISIVNKMNEATLLAVQEEASKYDLDSKDEEEIKNVYTNGMNKGHVFMKDYRLVIKNFSPEHEQRISEALSNNRKNAFYNTSYTSIQNLLNVVQEFCEMNKTVMQTIKKELLPSNEQLSQHEIDFQHELNHQT